MTAVPAAMAVTRPPVETVAPPLLLDDHRFDEVTSDWLLSER
jgi:hypothetical protein